MKLRTTITSLCALAAASTMQAQVIGDFEGALDPGWAVSGGTTAFSTTWKTSGNYSLRFTPAAAGFSWAFQFSDATVVQQLASTHLLQFDVAWIQSQWLPETGGDAWVRWDIGALNSDSGWQQITDASITDPANPSYPGSWDPINWGALHSRTLTYDFTGLTASGGWGQLMISENFGAAETIGSYYIDNVRLVAIPEPGTLALLGLAGAAMLIRRRIA